MIVSIDFRPFSEKKSENFQNVLSGNGGIGNHRMLLQVCITADGPPVPQSVVISGLRDSYSDVLEFKNLTFTCTEASKEPVGNMTVLRPFSSNPDDPWIRVYEVK